MIDKRIFSRNVSLIPDGITEKEVGPPDCERTYMTFCCPVINGNISILEKSAQILFLILCIIHRILQPVAHFRGTCIQSIDVGIELLDQRTYV